MTSEEIVVTCPVCEADMDLPKLAKLGLSFDELNKIKDHVLDGTMGQRLFKEWTPNV